MGDHFRYPGSRPFTDEYADVFFGRDEDVKRLSTLVTVEDTTVLYGKSGLGKSSLLNAGLLPLVEAEGTYLIIPVRLGATSANDTAHPLDRVEETLQKIAPAESLLSMIGPRDVTLWELIKDIAFAHPERRGILLVFDQFEELFTYSEEGVEELGEALGSVLFDRIPKVLDRALRLASERSPELLSDEQWEFLKSPIDVKALMSIRSDKMSLLAGISSDIPTILHNCYELKPLSREQATTAIESPAVLEGEFASPTFTYMPAAIEKILDFLTQEGQKSIETFQLQIFCEYAEQKVVIDRNDDYVEPEDLGDLEAIYESYYDTCIAKVADEGNELKLREFIEEGLIFEEEERRVSLFEGQIQSRFGITDEQIQKLVDSHLLRAEPHASGGFLYEVCHDTLVGPILKAKERRKVAEAEAERRQAELIQLERRRKKMVRLARFGGVPAAFAVFSLLAYLFAHRNDLDTPRLRGVRPATTYQVAGSEPRLEATISQEIGETRVTVEGLEIGSATVTVTGSDGSERNLDVEVTEQRVTVVETVEVDPLPDEDNYSPICTPPACSIADVGAAGRALDVALGGVSGSALADGSSGELPDSVRLWVPVSRELGEPNRWRPGLNNSPFVTEPDSLVLSAEFLEALKEVGRDLEFAITDTRTAWLMPVKLRLNPNVSQGRTAVGLGEEVTLPHDVRDLDIGALGEDIVSGFTGNEIGGTDDIGRASLAPLLFGSLGTAASPESGADGQPGRVVVSPEGSLRWLAGDPNTPWRLLGPDGDTLATATTLTSESSARFSPNGDRLLVTSTENAQIQGVPYTITSYADANRVTVDLGLDGVPDSMFVLDAGDHARLQNPAWADTVIGIESTSGITVVETTRYWWQEITEATQARAVRPIPEDSGRTWEYWVPVVDTFPGPNGGSSTVELTAAFENTTVRVDLEPDGVPDSVFTLDRGETGTVPVLVAGAVFRSNRPLSVTYQYVLTDWQTYEDGWLSYEIPPVESLGTDYLVPNDAGQIRVLATRDETLVRFNADGRDVALARGEHRSVPPSQGATRHISSDKPVIVAVANFSDDRHGATYAYVVPPTTDSLFYVPAVSPHHYPRPVDRSRVELLAVEDGTRIYCDADSVIVRAGEVHRCLGRTRAVVRASRPVSAIFISEVEARDSYTGDRRIYSYAHPQMGSSEAGTQYVLRPFPLSAVEGYQGGTSELRVLDDRGQVVDSLAVDGRVVETVSREHGGFRVAVQDGQDQIKVFTVGDPTSPDPVDFGMSSGVALTESGRHVLALREDESMTWHDLRAETVDTIPCSSAVTCGAWRSVQIRADGRLLLAQRDAGMELWAVACLLDTDCRLTSGPIRTVNDLIVSEDAAETTVALSANGRYVLAVSPVGEARLMDLNLRLPGEWSFDLVLLLINMPILVALAVLLLLAPPAMFYELVSGDSVLTKLRERGESEDTGFLARLGRWLS